MKSIDLIQPRHNYANPPEVEQHGHIYLPTSLYTAGARLAHAGVDVRFHDENMHRAEISSDKIGVNLVGAPYIPEVIALQKRIQETTRDDLQFILGGQAMRPSWFGISREQTRRLFGPNAVNGNDDRVLADVLDLEPNSLPRPENTSLIPVYEQIPDADMREYLSREFSLYVSQGCNQNCSFCGAEKGTPERYRDFDIIEKDLDYLVNRAARFDLKALELYLSNLDVFQSPDLLQRFAQTVKNVRSNHPGFDVRMRALATVPFFNKFKSSHAHVYREMVDAGLHTVGFGVDGWDNDLWRKMKKGNTQDECIEAIRSAKEDFGMTPEILMVFGHDLGDGKRDTPQSLEGAYAICNEMAEKYGAVPRPHVSKSFIPGSEGWVAQEHASAVELLMQHPEAFQSLDFTALPSPLTHPNREIRELATEYYLRICAIQGNITQHVKPITPDMSQKEIEEIKRYNVGRYDQ